VSDTEIDDLRRDVEALLFAAGRPLAVDEILRALSLAEGEERAALETTLESLAEEFPAGGARGFDLVRLAGGWVFRTNPLCRSVVAALFELPDDVSRLSGAAMECLSIVAYLQPVSRPKMAEIRGVNSDSPVRTLLERELITEVGREKAGGGAILYGTTQRFEAMFGLSDLDELPALEGFALTEDQKDDLRRRLGLLTVPE
jgi:segregation and condensation protein B